MIARWLQRNLGLKQNLGLKRNLAVACCVCVGCWVVGPAVANAQFLEKLEAAVREQLSQQSQANQPVGQQANGKPNQANGRPNQAEELPSPESNRPELNLVPSGSEGTALTVPKPIENGGRIVEGAGASVDAPRPTYLGFDVEEPVGGGLGVRVIEVTPNSPAWKAGFKVGDRILAINGFAIANLDAMVEQLTPLAAGESVRFLVNRGNRNLELIAVLQDAELAARIASNGAALGPAWMGIVVNDVTQAFRQQFGISLFRGAAVTSVTADSPAARAGIRAGDAVAEIGGRRIESAIELTDIIAAAKPGDVLEMKVAQGGGMRTLLVTLEEQPATGTVSPRARIRTQNRPTLAPDVTGPAIVPALGNPPAVTSVQPLPIMPPDVPTSETPVASVPMDVEYQRSAREQELASENARLRDELAAVNQRLTATQQRLDAILESLRQVTAEKKP